MKLNISYSHGSYLWVALPLQCNPNPKHQSEGNKLTTKKVIVFLGKLTHSHMLGCYFATASPLSYKFMYLQSLKEESFFSSVWFGSCWLYVYFDFWWFCIRIFLFYKYINFPCKRDRCMQAKPKCKQYAYGISWAEYEKGIMDEDCYMLVDNAGPIEQAKSMRFSLRESTYHELSIVERTCPLVKLIYSIIILISSHYWHLFRNMFYQKFRSNGVIERRPIIKRDSRDFTSLIVDSGKLLTTFYNFFMWNIVVGNLSWVGMLLE